MTVYRTDTGEIVFSDRGGHRPLTIPCSKCIGCKLERSRQWAVRCMHESSMHEDNCFVTLTYNEDTIPSDWSLRYRDFQLFMKRLRKSANFPVRFYMCGEYGETYSRPHYHACLFGYRPSDLYDWRKSASGFKLYRSSSLESIWSAGSVEVGDVTFESAAYVARYIVTKNSGKEYIVDPDTGELYARPPEFTRMSLKPGIGYPWYEKYKREVFPLDRVVVRGVECKPPRYYTLLLDRQAPFMAADVEYERYVRAVDAAADNTAERLRAKEVVCKVRISKLHRSFE